MIPELAHYALVLAFVLAALQATLPIWGARKNDATLMGTAEPLAIAGFGFIAFSFAGLVACFVQSDFSVFAVYLNSQDRKSVV